MQNIFIFQVFIEFLVFSVSLILLRGLLKKFKVEKFVLKIILFPLIIFVIGFILRLSGDQSLIDTGFFLTGYSLIFIYLLMGLGFMLGQIKYWKVKVK